MYILLTLKIEQARANCAIFMLLSRFVCSSESDESGIVSQRSGIILLSALQLLVLKTHLIQSTFPLESPSCRQGSRTGSHVRHILQKSWQKTALILGSVLPVQSLLVYLFLCMT